MTIENMLCCSGPDGLYCYDTLMFFSGVSVVYII